MSCRGTPCHFNVAMQSGKNLKTMDKQENNRKAPPCR
jgi:hypothetical protein